MVESKALSPFWLLAMVGIFGGVCCAGQPFVESVACLSQGVRLYVGGRRIRLSGHPLRLEMAGTDVIACQAKNVRLEGGENARARASVVFALAILSSFRHRLGALLHSEIWRTSRIRGPKTLGVCSRAAMEDIWRPPARIVRYHFLDDVGAEGGIGLDPACGAKESHKPR
jgi:hypothetical protein